MTESFNNSRGDIAPDPLANLDRCHEAFRRISGDTQQYLEEGGYVEMQFTDSKDRWVEARVSYRNGGVFLVENMGKPLALLELAEKFIAEGVRVVGIGFDYQTRISPEDEAIFNAYNTKLQEN